MQKNIFKVMILCLLGLIAVPMSAQRQKPVPLRVCTFNIRYENKEDGQNNWELRYQKVAEFLNKRKADVYGLQEVTHSQLTDLKSLVSDYDAIGVARDDGKEKGEYNPIFFNRNRFNLLRSGTFWLSDTPTEPSRGWDAVCRRIATWAILQDKTTLKSIVVLNTHLDHIGVQARASSAALIKERLGRMVNDLPVIVTGDFNCDEKAPVYTKMLTGIFPLRDVWKEAQVKKGPEYTYHGFGKIKPEDASKIDFIFVSSQLKVKKSLVIDVSLGDGFYISDHNAHLADLVY